MGALRPALLAAAALSFAAPAAAQDLKAPSEFDDIEDQALRSAAIFEEAARVIEHPRCMNCHPATRLPTQGDDMHLHVPFMVGGPADHGPAGLACGACHTEANVDTLGATVESVPGAPHWGLAPISMAWIGLTTGEICAQLQDLDRNGGRSHAQIHTHMMTDPLVGWAWDPGAGRTPVPGTQAQFGALIAAWIETGAACPRE
jgi:hypothetical protein